MKVTERINAYATNRGMYAKFYISHKLVTTNAKKDRRYGKTMTENVLDIQTISTRQTDFQADCVLLLEKLTQKKEKAHRSHFLKFLLASRINGTFGFARHTSRPFAKPKEPFPSNTY